MGRPLRVLIVDDSEDDARQAVRRLEQSGFSAFWKRVEAPEPFRAALSAQSWDLVLSDPSVPGFESLQALSVLQEAGADVPFVIVSGAISEEQSVIAIRAGAACGGSGAWESSSATPSATRPAPMYSSESSSAATF